MKIEAGKFYRTREGEKVGPMERYIDGWKGEGLNARPGDYLWKDDGSRYFDDEDYILVAEWVDPRAESTRAFDPAWPHGHVTRDGRKARIVCTDARGEFPTVALVPSNGEERPIRYGADGREASGCYGLDLINAPAPNREWWVNVYRGGLSVGHPDRTSADEAAATVIGGDRIACVRVTEGDGL